MILGRTAFLRLEHCDIGTGANSETSTESVSTIDTGQISVVKTGQMSAVCCRGKTDKLPAKSSGMGPRKKVLQPAGLVGVPGQVWPRPDFQVEPKTSKMA